MQYAISDESAAAALEMVSTVYGEDHGDYLGDHWLGEKCMFHNMSAKVPMIVYDPSPDADVTRGTVSEALVEMIDLAPTFIDYFGGKAKPHVLEGRSLLPLTRSCQDVLWRTHTFSEYDYSLDMARLKLDLPLSDCRLYMITDGHFKLVHGEGVPPMLFDLKADPEELIDLGKVPASASIVGQLRTALLRWLATPTNRITVTEKWFTANDDKMRRFDPLIDIGVLIGYWDETELAKEHEARCEWLTVHKPFTA